MSDLSFACLEFPYADFKGVRLRLSDFLFVDLCFAVLSSCVEGVSERFFDRRPSGFEVFKRLCGSRKGLSR